MRMFYLLACLFMLSSCEKYCEEYEEQESCKEMYFCLIETFEPTERDFENLVPIYDYIVEETFIEVPDYLLREATEFPCFWSYYYVIAYCMTLPEFGDTVGETEMWEEFYEKFYEKYFAYNA